MKGEREHAPMPSEAPRDQEESVFSAILRNLRAQVPEVLAATFVDPEGECVDYCSALPPFDAKVVGAHLQVVMNILHESVSRLDWGEPWALHLYATNREILARRVGAGYLLVVVVSARDATRSASEAMRLTVEALRREADLRAERWETFGGQVEVRLREAVGWAYAPSAYREASHWTEISAVMGRWTEAEEVPGITFECFRVRTDSGVEITLAHDANGDRWLRR